MRRLIYVPIIHTEADLGSLAEGIEERAKAVVGEGHWQQHKEVVRLYWQAIADYWQGKNVSGAKIFQDGMPADGTVGEKIVKSMADSGSINHKIIEQLLEKGAELIQTEEPELLKEEYFLARDLAQRKSTQESLRALLRYKWRKDKLLKARDAYISKRIDESLRAEETGICFLGAYHHVVSHLPKNIEVILLKDPEKVRAYMQKYTSKQWEGEVNKLSRYLTTPIRSEQGEQHNE